MGAGKPGRGRRRLGGRQARPRVQSWASRAGRGQWGLASFFLFLPESAPSSAHACTRPGLACPSLCPCLRVRMCIVHVYVAWFLRGVSTASLGFSAVHKLRPEDVKSTGRQLSFRRTGIRCVT